MVVHAIEKKRKRREFQTGCIDEGVIAEDK